MHSLIKPLAVIVAAALLTACGTQSGVLKRDDRAGEAGVEERVGDAAAYGQGGYGAESSGVSGAGALTMEALNDPTSLLSHRTIYFEYDSAEVTAEGKEILAAHAGLLAANPGLGLVLEGHTDERGSREYNIALGERRALAVRTLLLFQGALEDQLQTVSFGEEKPAAPGHEDAAWSVNRRVELVYPEMR